MLLSKFEATSQRWANNQYDLALRGAPFGVVRADWKDVLVRQGQDQLLRHADRSVRMEGFVRFRSAYRQYGDVLANSLLTAARESNDAARRRGFTDALDRTYFDLFLSREVVERMVKAFYDHRHVALRFQRANAAYVAKKLSLDAAEPYDLYAPLPGVALPRLTIADALDVIVAAEAVYGPDFVATLKDGVDPKNESLDVVPGSKRRSGAFTLVPFAGRAAMFMEGYNGYTPDVVTLGHELAHVVHHNLMWKANLPYRHTNNLISYLFEGVAKVNELLVLDELHKRATDPGERVFYLRELASKLADVRFTTMYWAVLATQFELELYRALARGNVTEADVHALWLRLGTEYSVGYDHYPDNAYVWADTPNFFRWPREYVNYLVAWVISLALYDRAQGSRDALAGLVPLMKAGFSDDPITLLKKYLAIDLADPKVLDGAFRVLEARVKAFEEAVAKE